MGKVVVLLSGGIDSSTLLYQNAYLGNEVYPLSINYGQRHNKEIIAARNICESLGQDVLSRWIIADLSSIGKLLPSALTGKGEIPNGHYTDAVMSQTVVPNRNMILLSLAVGYAQGIGARAVSYAAHAGDHPIYPDCRPEFFYGLSKAVDLATDGAVFIEAPYIRITKADIIKMGTGLKVPYHKTWSCYKGGDKHCGSCGTCVERKEAMRLAGAEDPTEYEK